MAADGTETRPWHEVERELAELRREVQALVGRAGRLGRNTLTRLETEAGESLDDGREAAEHLLRRIQALERRTEDSVREHPATWAGGLLGLLGFGLLLGLLIRGR